MYTKKEILSFANTLGVKVATYSPGDGVTRYKFYDWPTEQDYFAIGTAQLGRAMGAKEAYRWLQGFSAAKNRDDNWLTRDCL